MSNNLMADVYTMTKYASREADRMRLEFAGMRLCD